MVASLSGPNNNSLNKTSPSGLLKQPSSQHVGVGEDVTLTAIYKGDSPAQVVTWASRTSAKGDIKASEWKDMPFNTLKFTTSAIIYETTKKTSTSTLIVNDVNKDDEKDYRARATYATGGDNFYVNTTAVNIIIKCMSSKFVTLTALYLHLYP